MLQSEAVSYTHLDVYKRQILRTILTNYNEEATIIISTHLIADVEQILSDVIFINMGRVVLCDTVANIRQREQKSVDELFREEFRC